MLSYAKSGTARTGDRLNGFKNGKTHQSNSGEVVKWAYFQKEWSIPLKSLFNHCVYEKQLRNVLEISFHPCLFLSPMYFYAFTLSLYFFVDLHTLCYWASCTSCFCQRGHDPSRVTSPAGKHV